MGLGEGQNPEAGKFIKNVGEENQSKRVIFRKLASIMIEILIFRS